MSAPHTEPTAGVGGTVADPSPAKEPLLSVDQLRVTFPGEGGTRAVRGIDYKIGAGEIVGLVGESGCGKSVSVASLLGLVPDAEVTGTAMFEDRNLLSLGRSDLRTVRGLEIGMIFQDPLSSLNPVLTIERQVIEALVVHRGMRAREARERAVEFLALVGIPDPRGRLGDYPHQFSGGMRQRVMIAAALVCEPKLLIADEPTTALDVTIQAQILELLRRLRSELDMAMLIITHDLAVVAGIADRVNVMYAGEIVESGTTLDVLTAPRHPYTLGLLRSVPRLSQPSRTPLVPIPGRPPDLRGTIEGCPFRPRCAFAFDKCTEKPPLLPQNGHRRACWLSEEEVPAP